MWPLPAPLLGLVLVGASPSRAAEQDWTPARLRAALGLPRGCELELRRHGLPVVFVSSWTPRPGTVAAGTAHLVEHLSYSAVRGRAPGSWDAELEQLGGWSDGWTDRDGIEGLVVLPPEALEEGLALEAARLSGLATEQWTPALVERQWAVVEAEAFEHAQDPTASAFVALFASSHPYQQDPRPPAGAGLGQAALWWGPERVLVVLPDELAPAALPLVPPVGPAPAPWAVPLPETSWTVEVADGPAALQLLWRRPPCGDPARRQALEDQLGATAAVLGGQSWAWWGRQGAVLGVVLPADMPREAGARVSLRELWQGPASLPQPAEAGPIQVVRSALRQGVLADAPPRCSPLSLDEARLLQTSPGADREQP